MAKVNSVAIGKAKGSIGNVTFRTLKGQVIASQKQESKKGTLGTFSQVQRRVHWSNLVNAYRMLNNVAQGGMQDAFPMRAKVESAYNAFMRKNLAISDVFNVAMEKSTAQSGYVCPAPFMIAEGDLEAPTALQALITDGVITLPGSLSLSNMGALCTVLVNNYGFANGDTCTFFSMAWSVANGAKFATKQITIDTTSTASLPSWITSGGVITIDASAASAEGSEGVILRGRVDNGVRRISSAQFGDSMTLSEPYTTHTNSAYELQAMASYGYREEPYLQSNPQ